MGAHLRVFCLPPCAMGEFGRGPWPCCRQQPRGPGAHKRVDSLPPIVAEVGWPGALPGLWRASALSIDQVLHQWQGADV